MTNATGVMFCILNGNLLETTIAECLTNLHLEDKTLRKEAEECNKLYIFNLTGELEITVNCNTSFTIICYSLRSIIP